MVNLLTKYITIEGNITNSSLTNQFLSNERKKAQGDKNPYDNSANSYSTAISISTTHVNKPPYELLKTESFERTSIFFAKALRLIDYYTINFTKCQVFCDKIL